MRLAPPSRASVGWLAMGIVLISCSTSEDPVADAGPLDAATRDSPADLPPEDAAPLDARPDSARGDLPAETAAGDAPPALPCPTIDRTAPFVTTLGRLLDFFPACPGMVVAATDDLRAVVLLDAFTGMVHRRWPLPWAPESMTWDPVRQQVFVGNSKQPQILRLDPDGGQPVPLMLPQAPPVATALLASLGGDGVAVLTRSLQPPAGPPQHALLVLDAASGATLAEFPAAANYQLEIYDIEMMVHEPRSGQIIFGSAADNVLRFGLSLSPPRLLPLERFRAKDPLLEIALSPDGLHLAPVSATGSAVLYAIPDHSSTDLTKVRGHWLTGAFCHGAAFSPDSKLLAASNGRELFVFTVDTHELVASRPLDGALLSGCQADIFRVKWSADGKAIHALILCGGSPPEPVRLLSMPYPWRTP